MAKTNTPFETDITKMMAGFQLPVIDVQQWMTISQKNIEAMTAANQVAVEGMQAMMRRQAEIVKESIEEASSLVTEITAAGTPEDKMVRQVELLKQAYEQALSNAKELAELAAKSNEEAAEIITGRVAGSLDEIKAVAKKGAKKAA
jgi:phasin family protein